MKKSLLTTILLSTILVGCVSTPETAMFNGETVGTFSAAAGCNKLELDEDCSGLSGATRNIDVEGTKLRVAGGNEGKIVFIMAMNKFTPDELTLRTGAPLIEAYLNERGVEVIETKVMYSNDMLFGVHYTLDKDGYQFVKELTVSD